MTAHPGLARASPVGRGGRLARQRYRVLSKIDAGGMAEIYLARAIAVGGIEKNVAIKRVLPSLTKNKRFVNMFLDEARLSMVLTHANIVQVFDVGRSDGTYFLVMEFVDGHNLRRIFQRMTERSYKMPVHHAAYILMEICKGLAHAHDQRDQNGTPLGIVHRDISPPNILLSKSGEVKITDFGLAKAITQLEITDPGIVKGKFSYLSPEAANGKPVDHRADIFAAGILLWELLANRRLFLGKSDMETVELIRRAEVPTLQNINKEVTPELEGILAKSLARDPKQRWHSARDFGNALASYLFANNLKVTSYDVAATLQALFDTGDAKADPGERIGALIDEEVLNLSMLKGIPDMGAATGARPLNDFDVAGLGSTRLAISDIWSVRPPSLGERSDLAELIGKRQDELDAKARGEPSKAAIAVKKRWAWAVVTLVVLGGGAATAGYFLGWF